MPKYRFVVVTSAGSRVEAESEADSVEKLRERLAGRGCTVEKVECLDASPAAAPVSVSDPASATPARVAMPAPVSTGAPAAGSGRSAALRRCSRAVRAALGRRGIILASALLVVAAGALLWRQYGPAFRPSPPTVPPVKAREPKTLTVDEAPARPTPAAVAGKEADVPRNPPSPAPTPPVDLDRQSAEARQAVYREALREPKAVVSKAGDPAFAVALGRGWRESTSEGGDRLFLLGDNPALSFQVHTAAPLTGSAEARRLFLNRIGCEDHPDWPITEAKVTKADGRPWREWRAETDDHGVHTHWRGQWSTDLEHSYLLVSRLWDQTPELDSLAGQLLDQAFANFARAPSHTSEYRGGVRPYVFNLPGPWKPLDLSANGFDKAWEGPADIVLRVETGPGTYTPASLPALVTAARENFAKTYRLGPTSDAGRWIRFRADIDIDEKSYACFFSLTVAADAYYMISVVVPTANLDRCEPVVAEIQDAIKLP